MTDIFENELICNACNTKTEKVTLKKNNYQLRAWVCPKCRKEWLHPGDKAEFENFQRLRGKTFEVKLRMVGNSYAVSIPREIIQFEEEVNRMKQQMDRMIRMSMESPEKLNIFFTRRTTRIIKPQEEPEEMEEL